MNFHGSFRAGNLPINKILIKVITAGLFSYIPLNLLDKTIENITFKCSRSDSQVQQDSQKQHEHI